VLQGYGQPILRRLSHDSSPWFSTPVEISV
jgi:hypothetical protein